MNKGDTNKKGVEKTSINAWMREADVGYASKELFTQFLVRISKELPNSKLAMFSTLKYINAPNFEPFRRKWQAKFLGGFVVHNRAFDGLRGSFPIGFLIWDQKVQAPLTDITVNVLDKQGVLIAEKKYAIRPASTYLNVWIDKTTARGAPALPLANAFTVAKNPRPKKQYDGALGYFYASNNDLQHSGQETLITSSIYTGGNGGGVFITPENLWQVAVAFAVRILPSHTWQNHNDQFLQPQALLTEEFRNDCFVWMLFAGKNLTAGVDALSWKGVDYSLVNNFIPFTDAEIAVRGRIENDFVATYTSGLTLSPEAQAVLNQGRMLFQKFHSIEFPTKIKNAWKLGRADAGWYQIRRALEAYSDSDFTDFEPMKLSYAALSQKLTPMVYSLGFLPE